MPTRYAADAAGRVADALVASTARPRLVVAAAPYVLFCASGFLSLVYEVLWLRELAITLGSTAHAAAIALATFLGGAAVGSEIFGRRCGTLRTYARLEVAIAVATLVHVGLGWGSIALPSVVQVALFFAIAVLVGGTLPVMIRAVAPRPVGAPNGVLLYALNTLGASAGAAVAGFVLPLALGVRLSYVGAAATNLVLALAAWCVADEDHAPSSGSEAAVALPSWLAVAAFGSGLGLLALEVLWTRMLAQVLHNSVYSFAAVLSLLLLAFALGALVAHRACRLVQTEHVLAVALLATGMLVALGPHVFVWATGGLERLGGEQSFAGYVGAVFGLAALAVGPAALFAGVVYPAVLRACPVGAVGRVNAVNTLGAIVGAIAAGFVLLATVGLWASIRTIAVVYLLAAAATSARADGLQWVTWAAGLGTVAAVSLFDPGRLPVLRLDPIRRESLLQHWEGPDGIVAVVQRGDDLRLKVDNLYSLGGIAGRAFEGVQADLPMVLAAQARSVYFLGVGTGITAGAALRHPVEHVTAVELVPEVLAAARTHFAPYTNGLFTDPRALVLVDDGRRRLARDPTRYDVVVSDLFVPWQAGAGSLYTREHFATVRDRLEPGGVFAQWLPLYQTSRRELAIIARTMIDVFPQVTLWRGDFQPDHPIVALVGQEAGATLDPEALPAHVRSIRGSEDMDARDARAFTAITYAGNLTLNDELFRDAPVNRDDWPVLEYLAPRTQREQVFGAASWMTLLELDRFYEELFARVPPERDPYLARFGPETIEWVRAGAALARAFAYEHGGRLAEARPLAERFRAAVPYAVGAAFRDRIELLP